jgi:Putative beta-lactamase-inhibitor-like, PepSY-like
MKKIVMVLMACAALASRAYGEPVPADKVPASVRDVFKSKFPGVDKAEWKLKSDKNYEAEFSLKGVEVAAKFDAMGKWLETETAIEESALPKDVRATVEKRFEGYKIVETQKVERAGDKPILFEVHLEKGD